MIDAICRSLLTVNISSRHDSYAPDDTSFVYVRILLGWNEHGFHYASFPRQFVDRVETTSRIGDCLLGVNVDLVSQFRFLLNKF